MHPTTLVIGGSRSGKSAHALALASRNQDKSKLFIATCIPADDEMRARVDRHRNERRDQWRTLEEPLNLAEAIANHGPESSLILIDCLTLWTSNLMAACEGDEELLEKTDELCRILAHPPCPVILVSNEVGCGIVPDNAMARRFRDLAGWVNQRIAAACDQVIWMVAGIAVPIKTRI